MRVLIFILLFLSFAASGGTTQLVDENFDDQDWTDSGLSDPGGDGGELIYLPGVARSGNYAVKFDGSQTTEGLFRTMTISGSGGIFYIKYYIYYPNPGWSWDNMSPTGLKNIRFYYSGENFTWMSKDLNVYPLLCDPGEFVVEFGQFSWSDARSDGQSIVNEQNTWHKVEIYLEWYSNATTSMSVTLNDIVVHDVTCSPGLGSNNITMVQILAGNGFGTSGYYYVDDVEVWDEVPSEEEPPPHVSGITFSGVTIGQ
jgi:hypothetical protein